MVFENSHHLADDYYHLNCKENQSITHNVFTGYFYIWYCHNGAIDHMVILGKLNKVFSEYELKKVTGRTLRLKIIQSKTEQEKT